LYVETDKEWGWVESRPPLTFFPDGELDRFQKMITVSNKNMWESKSKILKKQLAENAKEWNFKENSVKKLSKKHEGETAYIVGNSPSLAKNVKGLKNKKGIILTSIHSTKFLLRNGVKPDYIGLVSVDKKQEKWALEFDSTGLILLADASISPKVLKKWKGKIYFFRASVDSNIKKDREITDFEDRISCGGNVMGGLYAIALGMGCKKIVFVGMDLSNGMNIHGQCPQYADGTIDYWFKNKTYVIFVDISGRGTMTTPSMYMYKIWFDYHSCVIRNIEHINATEGGILGAYPQGNLQSIKQMRLADVA
jgi:hypothetical protein